MKIFLGCVKGRTGIKQKNIKIKMSYRIYDFLIDQKGELNNLEKELRECKSEERIAEIKRQQTYLYNQGLRAMRRYSRDVPDSIKSYYLGNAEKPSLEKISGELRKIVVDHKTINRNISYIMFAIVFTILFLMAILS